MTDHLDQPHHHLAADLGVCGRPLSNRFVGWRFDVSAWLPADYAVQCTDVSRARGRLQLLTGDASTSRGRDFGDGALHQVFTTEGFEAMCELPWLHKLYHGGFLQLANRVVAGNDQEGRWAEDTYMCSRDARSALNINRLPVGETYEWHVDSNPLTGLLFCPTDPFSGGELVFRSDPHTTDDSWELRVRPEPGALLLFDAREVPHCVLPSTAERVTVPMNYYLSTEHPLRPPDLDAYLYD